MRQAIILAAGEGRRLRPFTVNKPKAMISVAGQPIIHYALSSLAASGIRNIVMVVGYKREQVFDYVGDGKRFGVEITYVTQDHQVGTGHALYQAAQAAEEQFLVLAGDKLITPETLTQIVLASATTVLVKRENNPSRYGVATVEEDRIMSLEEKPPSPSSNLINTGIYAFNRDIFEYLHSRLDIPEALNKMLEEKRSVFALETDATWLDVIYPWDIVALNAAVLGHVTHLRNGTIEHGVTIKGDVSLGSGTVIHASTYIAGPVVIGDGCEIGPHACIMPSTSIANNVVISPFTEIRNSVLADDVHVGSNSNIEDSVVDRGCNIGSHFCANAELAEIKIDTEHHSVKVGAMLGEGCSIGHGVVAQAGVICGNYTQVKSFRAVGGRLPDKSLVV